MIACGELDQVKNYRTILQERSPNRVLIRPDEIRSHFIDDYNIMLQRREAMPRLGYDPSRRDNGVLITLHGLMFSPSEEHHRVLKNELRTGSLLSSRAVYPHRYQILFTPLYNVGSIHENIKRVVSYMLKAKPYYANTLTAEGDEKKRYLPFHMRRLSDRDMKDYIDLCRGVSFRSLTITAGVPK